MKPSGPKPPLPVLLVGASLLLAVVPVARWAAPAGLVASLALLARRPLGAAAPRPWLVPLLLAATVLFYLPVMVDLWRISPDPAFVRAVLLALVDRRCLLDHGTPPTWVQWLAGGYPPLAHPADLSPGPLVLLVALVGSLPAPKLAALLAVATGAAGTALLARRVLGLGAASALVAGGLVVVGAALPAQVRAGALPSLWVGALPWALLAWHRRSWPGFLGALALLLVQAGPAALPALLPLGTWIALDHVGSGFSDDEPPPVPRRDWRARVRRATLLLGLFGALVAARAVGVWDLFTSPGLLPPLPDTATWRATVVPVDLPALGRSLLAAPAQAADPAWDPGHGLLFVGLAGALLAAAGLAGRRHWRLAVTAVLAFLLASPVGLHWGPWRLVTLALPSAMRLLDMPRYLLVPLALHLALLAAVGFDRLVARRAGPWALVLAALVLVEPAVGNVSLVTGIFAGVDAPAPWKGKDTLGPADFWPLSAEVQAIGADGRPASPEAVALYRYEVVRAGGLVTEGAAGLEPRYDLVVRGVSDWRDLLQQQPPSQIASNPAYEGEAYWSDRATRPPVMQEEPGRIVLDKLGGRGGRLVLNRRYDRRWRTEAGNVVSDQGRLAVDLTEPASQVVLVWGRGLAELAWVLSLCAWLGLALWGGWAALRRARAVATGPAGG